MAKIRKDPVDGIKEKKSESTSRNKSKWPLEKRSTKGIQKKIQAARFKKIARSTKNVSSDMDFTDLLDARCLEREAEPFLQPLEAVSIGVGNEALPQLEPDTENEYHEYIRETLEGKPNQIHLDASLARTELAADTFVLEMAVDASESIGARNSLEKMLAHQMAACHFQAMRLMAKANGINEDSAAIQRLINASARLMNTYQQALHTLHKMRTGGRQVVTVQHLNISDGGQAMVAGNVNTGGGKDDAGGDRK